MLESIKKIRNDISAFLIILIVGCIIGWVIALASFSLNLETKKISLADIGGFLAGLGTVGLLMVAMRWKAQVVYQERRKALSNWYIEATMFNKLLKTDLGRSLALYSYYAEEFDLIKSENRAIKIEISNTKDFNKRLELRSQQQQIFQQMEGNRKLWHQARTEYFKRFEAIKTNRFDLETAEKLLIATLKEKSKKDYILDLSEYFNLSGKQLGVNDLRRYENDFLEKIDSKKQSLDNFYEKEMQQSN